MRVLVGALPRGVRGVRRAVARVRARRAGLRSAYAQEKGGLSGQPLFDKSTRVLAKLHRLTQIPLIGVGGVASAEQAYAKICAGASGVQL